MPMLLVWGPHLENYCCKQRKASSFKQGSNTIRFKFTKITPR